MDAILYPNIDPLLCPLCNVPMRQSKSQRCGANQVRKYRCCPECDRRDTVLVETIQRVVWVRSVRPRTEDAEQADEPR
jgi:hypothetical protein